MNKITSLFFKGFFTLFPVVVTIDFIVWVFAECERLLKPVIMLVVPSEMYFSGMSIVLIFMLLVAIGALVNVYLFKCLDQVIEKILESIPLVRTFYSSIKDISEFMLKTNEKQELGKVALVTVAPEVKAIGFVTQQSATVGDADDLVAVYLPMSFQMGGYTLFLPESKLEYIDMEPQEAMKMVLTGGLNQGEEAEAKD